MYGNKGPNVFHHVVVPTALGGMDLSSTLPAPTPACVLHPEAITRGLPPCLLQYKRLCIIILKNNFQRPEFILLETHTD